MPLIGREDVAGVGLVPDEDVVEGFASDAAESAFAVRVQTGSLWRTVENLHLLGPKDGIERLAVLAIAVAQQEAQGTRRVCLGRRWDSAPAAPPSPASGRR
ncbi:hypothetical protein [Streptomyces sp. NEAU-174]|uniref:hypothetical protein n=1 Tax=Streptomyces sp. NEAU-174 TaxID=3458254 RepID=UPI004044BDA2